MPPKSPAWSMYAKEWLASEDIALMPLGAEGLYIRLLNVSWDNGGLPTDPEAIKELVPRKYVKAWSQLWPSVRRKFVERHGRLVNDRQEEEREKQATRRAEQQDKAKKRWAGHATGEAPADASASVRQSPRQSLTSTSTFAGKRPTDIPVGSDSDTRQPEHIEAGVERVVRRLTG